MPAPRAGRAALALVLATAFAAGAGEEPDRAFFILQKRHLRSVDWPEAYRRYRVFVCNPGLDDRHLDAVRRAVPGALCLAYTSLHDASIGVYELDPYFRALTAAFPESLCIRETGSGDLVTLHVTHRGVAIPSYVMTKETADVLVEFHRDETLKADWDGFYLDVCNATFPAHRKRKLARLGVPVDFDGDGSPDPVERIDAVYEKWRPYFTARMREIVGPDRLLVGNSGGPLVDPALNGITLEGVGVRFDPEDARDWIRAQRAVAAAPFCSILWSTTAPAVEPSRRLARESDGVFLGTMAHTGVEE